MAGSGLISTRLGAIEQYEVAVPGEEAVHEMRVAVRRLRAVLRVLGLRDLDPPAKRLQDALGEVRDLQLQVQWLRGRDEALLRSRQARLRQAEQVLARELRRWRAEGLPPLLTAADASVASSRKVNKVLRRRLARLEERLEKAWRRLTPQALHRARISVKQVRYLLEVTKKSLPRKALSLGADLRTLQATLGELHDVDVRIGLVKRKPALLRDQQDERKRLGKIASAQLTRWHQQRLAERAGDALR